jgi:3-oxoadipate enol-lactonase
MNLPDHSIHNDNGKVTIFLLHGIYGAKEYWRPTTLRLIERGYRVVAMDAPGYGLSPLPEEFSFDVVAQAAARLVNATASEKNLFYGHSMGGQITPRIFSKAKDRINAIVIGSTIGYFGNRTKEEQAEFVAKRTAPPPPGTDALTAQRMVVDSMLSPGASGPEVELVRDIASSTPPATVQKAVKAVSAYPESEAIAMIKGVTVPALLVAGEVDQTGHPAGMKRVADMIRGAEFGVVPGCGHYPWAENPREFGKIFFDFLDRHLPAK